MNKVFGIGWAKTGTTTLGKCFEILGYDHQPQKLDLVANLKTNDMSKILAIVKKKDSFEDWPWLLLFKEFDQAFPGSRFVLTRRDTEKWIKSYSNMLRTQGEASEELNEIRRVLYGLPFPNVTEDQLTERYERHNQDVIDYFRDRPKDLLIVNWEKGDGWQQLCEFLGEEMPSKPFPHANQGTYTKRSVFSEMRRKIKAIIK